MSLFQHPRAMRGVPEWRAGHRALRRLVSTCAARSSRAGAPQAAGPSAGRAFLGTAALRWCWHPLPASPGLPFPLTHPGLLGSQGKAKATLLLLFCAAPSCPLLGSRGCSHPEGGVWFLVTCTDQYAQRISFLPAAWFALHLGF